MALVYMRIRTGLLCSPDLLDGLSQSNVVGLELVETVADNEHGQKVEVLERLARDWDSPCWEVVGDGSTVMCQYQC